MDQTKDNQHPCRVRETDEKGNPNLCCCGIIGNDGKIEDACFQPADGCC